MSLLGTIGAIAGSIGGSLFDRNEARHSAKTQYKYNDWLQNDNQAFQLKMAQNAHQYEMNDLKKAGLNPVLSAQGSSAGSIAGSSSPQGTSPGNPGGKFSEIMNTALNSVQVNSSKKLNESQEKLNNQQILESAERTKNITPEAKAKIKQMNSATLVNEAEKDLKESQTDINKGGIGAKILGSDKNIKDLANIVSILGGGLGTIGGMYKGYKAIKSAKQIMKLKNSPLFNHH